MSKSYYGRSKSPATLITVMVCIFILLVGGLLAFVGKGYSKISDKNKDLETKITNLTETVDELKQDNLLLKAENVTLSEKISLSQEENKKLSEKNLELQEKLNTQPEFKIIKDYETNSLVLVSKENTSKEFRSSKNILDLGTDDINNYIEAFSVSNINFADTRIDCVVRYQVLKFNETENDYFYTSYFEDRFVEFNPETFTLSFVVEYGESISEENKSYITNNSGEMFECSQSLEIYESETESGKYDVIFKLSILICYGV